MGICTFTIIKQKVVNSKFLHIELALGASKNEISDVIGVQMFHATLCNFIVLFYILLCNPFDAFRKKFRFVLVKKSNLFWGFMLLSSFFLNKSAVENGPFSCV